MWNTGSMNCSRSSRSFFFFCEIGFGPLHCNILPCRWTLWHPYVWNWVHGRHPLLHENSGKGPSYKSLYISPMLTLFHRNFSFPSFTFLTTSECFKISAKSRKSICCISITLNGFFIEAVRTRWYQLRGWNIYGFYVSFSFNYRMVIVTL